MDRIAWLIVVGSIVGVILAWHIGTEPPLDPGTVFVKYMKH